MYGCVCHFWDSLLIPCVCETCVRCQTINSTHNVVNFIPVKSLVECACTSAHIGSVRHFDAELKHYGSNANQIAKCVYQIHTHYTVHIACTLRHRKFDSKCFVEQLCKRCGYSKAFINRIRMCVCVPFVEITCATNMPINRVSVQMGGRDGICVSVYVSKSTDLNESANK